MLHRERGNFCDNDGKKPIGVMRRNVLTGIIT